MISGEILSGEVTSRSAKRVLYPIIIISILNFVSSVVRWQVTGYSGFTRGTPDGAGYSVVEHGRRIYLSAGQYRLGRLQIAILFVGVVVWFMARVYFSRTGDLRREKRAA